MGGVLISFVDLAADIAALLETHLTVDRVAVTADEPPATDDCSAAYVWFVRIYDSGTTFSSRGDDPTCLIRRTYEFGYRIDVCRTVRNDGKELSPEEYLADATKIGDLMDTAYCALAEAAIDNTLFTDLISCENINLGDLVVENALGDRISAIGTIKVTNPCPAGS